MTEDLYTVVQGILADPRRIAHRHGTDRKYLGSGLFLCDVCSTPVVSFSSAGAGPRYRCPNGHFTRTMRHIDAVVVRFAEVRLADPRLIQALSEKATGEAEELAAEVKRLRRRLKAIEADYDAELIDGKRYAVATEKVKAELAPVVARRAELIAGSGVAKVLTAADPVAEFRSSPLMIQRSVVDALLVARIAPAPPGSRTFNPETVKVKLKGARS